MTFKIFVTLVLYIFTGGALFAKSGAKYKYVVLSAGLIAIAMSFLFWGDVYNTLVRNVINDASSQIKNQSSIRDKEPENSIVLDWKVAQELNTIAGYEEFASVHAGTSESVQARQNIDELKYALRHKGDWALAIELGSIEGYQQFINEHPLSVNVPSAKQFIEARNHLNKAIESRVSSVNFSTFLNFEGVALDVCDDLLGGTFYVVIYVRSKKILKILNVSKSDFKIKSIQEVPYKSKTFTMLSNCELMLNVIEGGFVVWDIQTQSEKLKNISEPNIQSFDISRDEKLLVTGHKDKWLKIWNLESGSIENQIKLKHIPSSVSLSPDQRTIAYGDQSHNLILLDVETRSITDKIYSGLVIMGANRQILDITFSNDSKNIFWTSRKPKYLGYDTENKNILFDYKETSKGNSFLVVGNIDYSPAGKVGVLGEAIKPRIFEATTGKPLFFLEDPSGRSGRLAKFSPDAKHVYIFGAKNRLSLWSLTYETSE